MLKISLCLLCLLPVAAQEDYRAKAETCRQLAEDRNLTAAEREAAALLAAKCERLATAAEKKETDDRATCVKELRDLGASYRSGRTTKAEFDRRFAETIKKFTKLSPEDEKMEEDFMRRHPDPVPQRALGSILTLHLLDGQRVTGRFISETTERIVLAVGDRYVAVLVADLKLIEQNTAVPPPQQGGRRNREAPRYR
ncbi:MAG: hypothetical protein Q8K86_09525 [Candidatus Nanopelagicaceae bacterium]|nr:hypothetical protein [Candidatus Nanopelagicaceae bacterium]